MEEILEEDMIKEKELSVYAVDYVVKIRERMDKEHEIYLNQILAYLYSREGHPIKSFVYRRHLLKDRIENAEENG